jgi:hypothetical protein
MSLHSEDEDGRRPCCVTPAPVGGGNDGPRVCDGRRPARPVVDLRKTRQKLGQRSVTIKSPPVVSVASKTTRYSKAREKQKEEAAHAQTSLSRSPPRESLVVKRLYFSEREISRNCFLFIRAREGKWSPVMSERFRGGMKMNGEMRGDDTHA